MSLGFVMMAHEALDRAGQVARHLASHGCPVVIHVDRRTPRAEFHRLVEQVSDLRLVHFAPRIACDWGTWSLVQASRDASAQLLDLAPDLTHVALISGACLPIKPMAEIVGFLKRYPDTDFIESVTISDAQWTKGGLSEERFTLSFPFAWKRRRRLFDLWVDIQRRAGRRRPVPEGLDPHMGSQWWCLTAETLRRILNDPDRARFDRYFRRVWIPDESYFATLARRHARAIESRSLTFSRFDFQGKPHLFYDDHLALLRQSSAFFARKIWPGARRLYGAFIGPVVGTRAQGAMPESLIDRIFDDALQRRTRGRDGLRMAGRYPSEGYETRPTAQHYAVFHGFDDVFEDFGRWFGQVSGSCVHGHLFAPEGAEFADGRAGFAGALSPAPMLRDYDPESFLRNLVWNTRGQHQSFLFSPRDAQGIVPFLARDPNATVFAISGAWAAPLARSGRPVAELRAEAARLQQREVAHLDRLRERRTRARVHVWSLAEALERPGDALSVALHDILGPRAETVATLPQLRDDRGIAAFLQELRNSGMDPYTAGPFTDRRAAHEPSAPGTAKRRSS